MCNSASTSHPETREHTHKTCATRFVTVCSSYGLASPSKCIPGKTPANARMLPPSPSTMFGCAQTKTSRYMATQLVIVCPTERCLVRVRRSPIRTSDTSTATSDACQRVQERAKPKPNRQTGEGLNLLSQQRLDRCPVTGTFAGTTTAGLLDELEGTLAGALVGTFIDQIDFHQRQNLGMKDDPSYHRQLDGFLGGQD